MENRYNALDGECVFRARKWRRPSTSYDVKMNVLSYWTVAMHKRSEIEFHGLHKASVYW